MWRWIARSTFAILSLFSVSLAAQGQQPPPPTVGGINKGQIRDTIVAWNAAWGQARMAVDTAAFNRLLSANYSASMNGQPMSRAEFLAGVSAPPPGVTMTRFDVRVLAIVRTQDGWDAVIEEKIEFDRRAADGTTEHTFHLWVIRDHWTQVNGRWEMVRGEVIGNESWRGGSRPPFSDW